MPLLQILYPWTNVRGQVQFIRGVSHAWVLHTWTDVDGWLESKHFDFKFKSRALLHIAH